MYPFDENDESGRIEDRIRNYFQEFSNETRNKLLSKNVTAPKDIYEVFYKNVRDDLMAKNNYLFKTDLESSSEAIRKALLNKFVSENFDLYDNSIDFRKSLISRNNIENSQNDLVKTSDIIRNSILSKNKSVDQDLNDISKKFRQSNKSKNIESTGDLLAESSSYRSVLMSKNEDILNSLLSDISVDHRNANLSKKEPPPSDVYEGSEKYREVNIRKNVIKRSGLSDESSHIRDNQLHKNNYDKNQLNYFTLERERQLSKNEANYLNIEDNSEQHRVINILKNVSNDHDLLSSSKYFREISLKYNDADYVDLENISSIERVKNVSKNIKNKSSIYELSLLYRGKQLSKNDSNIPDLKMYNDGIKDLNISKNKPADIDLDTKSEGYRDSQLKKNKSISLNIDAISSDAREDNISKNVAVDFDIKEFSKNFISSFKLNSGESNVDLVEMSKKFRNNVSSFNKKSFTDLRLLSKEYRDYLLSINKPSNLDINGLSDKFRSQLLSYNKKNEYDLELESLSFRKNLLSLNIPGLLNLEPTSSISRNSLLSLNTPKSIDIESESFQYRSDLISKNIPLNIDLQFMSIIYRNDLTSNNVSSITDLQAMSKPIRINLLSSNQPSNNNLQHDSLIYRNNILSTNISSTHNLQSDSIVYRDDLLSHNSIGSGDLLMDSAQIRNDLLSSNIDDTNSNLLMDSKLLRNNLLSKNVKNNTDIFKSSAQYRKHLLSKNNGLGLLGVNIHAGGTSTFIGVSRVRTQGLIYRKLLTRRNKNPFEKDGVSIILKDPKNIDIRERLLRKNAAMYYSTSERLQTIFGLQPSPSDNISKDVVIGISGNKRIEAEVHYLSGKITNAIRKHNIERNMFNLNGFQPGAIDGLSELQSFNDPGFQDLINRTLGSFRDPNITLGITTPLGIVSNNNGRYLKGEANFILRPEESQGLKIGSPDSMVSKSVAGNPFDDLEFSTGKRGVKYIINTIKKGDKPFYKNYENQTNNAYVIGTSSDGSPKISRQTFTLDNPYAPKGAGKLIFSFKNYSIGESGANTMYFPPYISSFNLSEAASWNAVQFLGRPEPMYTYNNSTRDGSITFFVLTDYAQKVDIGRDFSNNELKKITMGFDKNFTDINSNSSKDQIDLLNAKVKKTDEEIQRINSESDGDAPNQDVNNKKILGLNNLKSEMEKKIGELSSNIKIPNYSEVSQLHNNIYDSSRLSKKNTVNGSIDYGLRDTVEIIEEMKKNLMFQPAFFSGDKVDFLKRVEFLSKMTRPARNTLPIAQGGFSFIKPPICHLHLGDWINHDIVVNSVSYDFSDVTWTVDEGRVQPMWTNVTVSFNIIGPYRHGKGGPLTSTDEGGYFSDRTFNSTPIQAAKPEPKDVESTTQQSYEKH